MSMRPWIFRGGGILKSNRLVKVDGDQASSKEKQVQIDDIKAMCFLLSADQKRRNFLLKQLRGGDKVIRYYHPVMATSALDILIHTEGGIRGNHKFSTYKIAGVE